MIEPTAWTIITVKNYCLDTVMRPRDIILEVHHSIKLISDEVSYTHKSVYFQSSPERIPFSVDGN